MIYMWKEEVELYMIECETGHESRTFLRKAREGVFPLYANIPYTYNEWKIYKYINVRE